MIPRVPQETPLLTASGSISRPWVMFLESLAMERESESSGVLADIPHAYHPVTNPRGLRKEDSGYRYTATDYSRTFTWDGTNWNADPGDPSGRLGLFAVDPGAGWRVLDGAAAVTITKRTFANAAAATQSIPIGDQRGAYVKGSATYSGGVLAATAPGIIGSTDPESSHTHGSGTLAAGAALSFTGTTGGANNVASSIHTHSITGATGSGSAHMHGAGTLQADATGEPDHYEWLPYIRL